MGQLTSPQSRLTGKMFCILFHYFQFDISNGWRRLHIGPLLRYLRYHVIIVALQNAIEQYCNVMKSSLPIKYGMCRQVRKLLFLRDFLYLAREDLPSCIEDHSHSDLLSLTFFSLKYFNTFR